MGIRIEPRSLLFLVRERVVEGGTRWEARNLIFIVLQRVGPLRGARGVPVRLQKRPVINLLSDVISDNV